MVPERLQAGSTAPTGWPAGGELDPVRARPAGQFVQPDLAQPAAGVLVDRHPGREAAMVMFLLDTGARRARACRPPSRRPGLDLDLDVGLVLGKGHRERAFSY